MKWRIRYTAFCVAVVVTNCALGSLESSPARKSDTPPNIILLLADDLGYRDLSCYGGTAVPTPYIDSLAAEGIRFTQFYAGSAVCTPTRASILTGRYPLRWNICEHFTDRGEHLPADIVTLPKLLRQGGYQTAHAGKWHLGGVQCDDKGRRLANAPGPGEQGFDHYLVQIEQPNPRWNMGKRKIVYREGGSAMMRDGVRIGRDDPYYYMHLTDIYGDYAVSMIEKMAKKKKPFFLNIWWLVPHTPYEPAPQPFWRRTSSPDISDMQHRFRSMMAQMDTRVGDIIAKLKELGIYNDTLILFLSDNGGAYECNNGELKGGKTDLHEGGLRVPLIACWPRRIKTGVRNGEIGHTNDLLPTLCEVAGIKPPVLAAIDGISLWPHFLDEKDPVSRSDPLFWQLNYYDHIQRYSERPKPYATEAVRNGKWKLLAWKGEPTELFDIETDLREEHNLLEKMPNIVNKMKDQLADWLNEPRIPYGVAESKYNIHP